MQDFKVGAYEVRPWRSADGTIMATVHAPDGAIVYMTSAVDIHELERKVRKHLGVAQK